MKLNKVKNMWRTVSGHSPFRFNTMHLVYIRRYQPEPVAPDERR